jgi:hypothetical protein
VAVANEQDAFAALRAAHPEVEILSRHPMDLDLIGSLFRDGRKGCEWLALEPNDKFDRIGGVPIDQPVKL